MIPLSHPLVQDYLRSARAHPGDSSLVLTLLWDRLCDEGNFPFPGTPGGLDLATLCWWYARGADEDERALREALATFDEEFHPAYPMTVLDSADFSVVERPKQVRRMRENIQVFVRTVSNDDGVQRAMQPALDAAIEGMLLDGHAEYQPLSGHHPAVQAAEKLARAAVCRDLRRRVLALYPEVEVVIEATITARQTHRLANAWGKGQVFSFEFLHHDLLEAGFVFSSRDPHSLHRRSLHAELLDEATKACRVTQTLLASDLIPSETTEERYYTVSSETYYDSPAGLERFRVLPRRESPR